MVRRPGEGAGIGMQLSAHAVLRGRGHGLGRPRSMSKVITLLLERRALRLPGGFEEGEEVEDLFLGQIVEQAGHHGGELRDFPGLNVGFVDFLGVGREHARAEDDLVIRVTHDAAGEEVAVLEGDIGVGILLGDHLRRLDHGFGNDLGRIAAGDGNGAACVADPNKTR